MTASMQKGGQVTAWSKLSVRTCEELGFLVLFDRAMEGVRAIVDMPERRAALLIRLMLQNGGRLSNSKRGQFDELTNAEIAGME